MQTLQVALLRLTLMDILPDVHDNYPTVASLLAKKTTPAPKMSKV